MRRRQQQRTEHIGSVPETRSGRGAARAGLFKTWNKLAGTWVRTVQSTRGTPEELRALEPKLGAQSKGLSLTVPKIQDAGLRARFLAAAQTYREKLRAIRHIDDAVADGKPAAVRRGFDDLDAAGTHGLKAANDLLTYARQHR